MDKTENKIMGLSGKLGSGKSHFIKEIEKILKLKGIPFIEFAFAWALKCMIISFFNLTLNFNHKSGKNTVITSSDVLCSKQEAKNIYDLHFGPYLKTINTTSDIEQKRFETFYDALGSAFLHLQRVHGTWGKMLQVFGTEITREIIGNNIWISIVELQSDLFFKQNPNGVVCVSDCRFKNEAKKIFSWSKNARIVRIEATLENRLKRTEDDSRDPNHISETDLDDSLADFYVIENNGSVDEFNEKIQKCVTKIVE